MSLNATTGYFSSRASGLYRQEVIKSITHAGAMLRAKRTRSNHGERIVEIGSGPGMLAFELAFQLATRVSSLVLTATIKTAGGNYQDIDRPNRRDVLCQHTLQCLHHPSKF